MSDYGAQGIRWSKPRKAEAVIGTRSDGAVMSLADAEVAVGGETRVKNETVDIISRLYHFGLLGQSQRARIRRDALDRLRADFLDTGMQPSVGMNYSPLGSHGQGEITDKQDAAYSRYRAALRALGPV